MLNPLKVCITYDDNFEPLCSNLCSTLLKNPNLKIALNKIECKNDYAIGFQSENWYNNLYEKIIFAIKNIKDEKIICVCDADIQFFNTDGLIKAYELIAYSDIEYLGQREQDQNLFNGGFFIIKKNKKTINFLEEIVKDFRYFREKEYAEQELINELIPAMKIKSRFLSRSKYITGCMRNNCYVCAKNKNIVMHHATCTNDLQEKMEQMNEVREKIGLDKIKWTDYMDI